MSIDIIGTNDIDRVYCAGSFTKFLTTFVVLSLLAEKYALDAILDDDQFLDTICTNKESKEFLSLFQNIIGSQFSIRDLCSYYSGLPYTFDLSDEELARVEAGYPFKHHSIPDETTFLYMCKNKITPVYTNRCKFHYSEIAIIFLGYLIEKIYHTKMENLYQQHLVDKFQLKSSTFSRKMTDNVYIQDLSNEYDYPSIAILDHGYFCYSNGYYTTLNDLKKLLEQILDDPVFKQMTNIKKARAASNRLLNGLAVEIRLVDDDIIYGYEGLSFSGCNIWAYSTKHKQGLITFSNSEEEVYNTIYDTWNYSTFDKVPDYSQQIYSEFIKHYPFNDKNTAIPLEFQGDYHRVNINEKTLNDVFLVGDHFMVIRNPEMIRYDIVFANHHYCVKGKDGIHGGKVGFYTAISGNKYMLYDGTLYKKL